MKWWVQYTNHYGRKFHAVNGYDSLKAAHEFASLCQHEKDAAKPRVYKAESKRAS